MTDNLRARIARAAQALAHDVKTDPEDDEGLILIDPDQLLDTIQRIVEEHIASTAGTPIEVLHLQPRVHNALLRYGTRTLEQLAACTTTELLTIRNFGQLTLAEIQTALAARGLTLADTPDTPAAPAGPADFFRAHRIYIQTRPDGAPEHSPIFRCEAVITRPGKPWAGGDPDDRVAVGFTPAGGDVWSLYVCGSRAWAEGWTEYDETEGA